MNKLNIFPEIIKRANTQIPEKVTIDGMLLGAKFNSYARGMYMHEDIKNRLSYKILCLENMPYGLGQMRSIKKITDWYIQSYKDLENFDKTDVKNYNKEFKELLSSILERHSTTFTNVSKGIFEWKNDLDNRYGETDDFFNSEDVELVTKDIDDALNIFYENRTSTRLLINHYIDLDSNQQDDNVVGSVYTKVNPIEHMINAWDTAKMISEREYGFCPGLAINNDTFFSETFIKRYEHIYIPYIPIHMRNIFFEIFKNSIRATIDKYGEEAEKEENMIKVAFDKNISNTFDVKISDKGIGISRDKIEKIWSYFYTTSPNNILKDESFDHVDFAGTGPLAGLGYGLPITKLMMNYFDGIINVNSLENVGTDVNLYF